MCHPVAESGKAYSLNEGVQKIWGKVLALLGITWVCGIHCTLSLLIPAFTRKLAAYDKAVWFPSC